MTIILSMISKYIKNLLFLDDIFMFENVYNINFEFADFHYEI